MGQLHLLPGKSLLLSLLHGSDYEADTGDDDAITDNDTDTHDTAYRREEYADVGCCW